MKPYLPRMPLQSPTTNQIRRSKAYRILPLRPRVTGHCKFIAKRNRSNYTKTPQIQPQNMNEKAQKHEKNEENWTVSIEKKRTLLLEALTEIIDSVCSSHVALLQLCYGHVWSLKFNGWRRPSMDGIWTEPNFSALILLWSLQLINNIEKGNLAWIHVEELSLD